MASFVPHSHLTLLQLHSLGSPRYPECLNIRRTLQNRPSSVTKLGNGSSLSRSRGTVVVACASTSGVESSDSPKPTRRGRKKKEAPTEAPGTEPATRKTTRSRKSPKGSTPEEKPPTSGAKSKPDLVADESEQEEEDFDDGIDFPYEDPPLVCCFGAARREFVPTVRVSPRQMHPDKYSTWKALQWNPPEFVRAPGGAPSNVAIAHVRLGGRAAFMGKVGDDDYGKDVVLKLNQEKVQTRALRIQQQAMTAATRMKVHYDEGGRRMLAETTGPCAEDSLSKSELDLSVLKEARIFHFSSDSLLSASLQSALFRAIKLSKRYSGAIFFDPNLPLPLWESRQKTWELIEKAWKTSTLIEVSRQELEFLLDEDYYEAKRNYRPQYYSESYEQAKNRRDYYHYTREEILPLWHDDLKILFVTDGTHRIHYYTPEFDGVVVGTEDVLITPFTCDRTGSGDAVVAGIMRKLTIHPDMCNDQDLLERHLRFAIAAGIISQWTIGAVRGFPTESATQNLKEQVYVPSMW